MLHQSVPGADYGPIPASRNRAWNVISITDRWVLQAGWWRSDGTEKRDYVLVEAEGMDGGATAVELYLGVNGWMLGRVMA